MNWFILCEPLTFYCFLAPLLNQTVNQKLKRERFYFIFAWLWKDPEHQRFDENRVLTCLEHWLEFRWGLAPAFRNDLDEMLLACTHTDTQLWALGWFLSKLRCSCVRCFCRSTVFLIFSGVILFVLHLAEGRLCRWLESEMSRQSRSRMCICRGTLWMFTW